MPLPNVTRRDLLAAAGLAMLADVASGQDNPGEAVADRTTTIKITRVTPLPGGSKVYVKIETNHGVTGYGEITGLDPKVAAALVTSLFELLKDENPTRITYYFNGNERRLTDVHGHVIKDLLA